MTDSAPTHQCARCGTEFELTADHSEIVRRDFVDRPRPSTIERLCIDCWQVYVDEFLDEDFEVVRAAYESGTAGEE